ncbi:MAG: molybdopterin-dependent oxidoreductase [Chloroflexi bacterium]|nr:molybdopterin-dependent oxidoreductase [Chloroflexota bacterium]
MLETPTLRHIGRPQRRADAPQRLTGQTRFTNDLAPAAVLHVLSGTNTTFAMIAAEVFGLANPEQVRVTMANTDHAPYVGRTGGSKVT